MIHGTETHTKMTHEIDLAKVLTTDTETIHEIHTETDTTSVTDRVKLTVLGNIEKNHANIMYSKII